MGYLSPLLAVRDMKKTLDFYTRHLGFDLKMCFPSPDNPQYADIIKDGMVIMFVPAEAHGLDAKEKLGAGVYFYLHIDGDIDKYYNELKQKGVRIAVDIKDEPFGVRDFTVEDGDGYKLVFNQPLKQA